MSGRPGVVMETLHLHQTEQSQGTEDHCEPLSPQGDSGPMGPPGSQGEDGERVRRPAQN